MTTSIYEQNFNNADNLDKVLKPKPLKMLYNRVNGNLFSYSYKALREDESVNSEHNLEWVTEAPVKIQNRINKVRKLHQDKVAAERNLSLAAKKKDVAEIYRLQDLMIDIDREQNEIIYPLAEREMVESAEARRKRLEATQELNLSKDSIDALKHKMG